MAFVKKNNHNLVLFSDIEPKLMKLLNIKSKKELARELGLKRGNQISQYKTQNTIPYEGIIKLAKEGKISLDELFLDKSIEGDHFDRKQLDINIVTVSQAEIKQVKKEDYYAAPLVEGRFAAGYGRIVSDNIKSYVWIYGPALETRKRHCLIAVQLAEDADSMEPNLLPGDIILIDRSDPSSASEFTNGKIYAIRVSGSPDIDDCAIKRLSISGESVMISSDNSAKYHPEIAWTNDLQKLIIGRVIWGWRDMLEI